MPVGSRVVQPVAKVKPISSGGSASRTMYSQRGKKRVQQQSQPENRGVSE